MKHKQSIGKNLFGIRDWITSYLIVLIIPIVICSGFFLYNYMVIWEEVNDSNAVALQIVASELDDIFERTFTVEYTIQKNATIKSAEKIKLPLNSEKRIELMTASRALDGCMTGETTIIDSWQLFYPSNEMMLLTGSAYTDMYGSYIRTGEEMGFSYDEWETLLKQRNNRKFLVDTQSGNVS